MLLLDNVADTITRMICTSSVFSGATDLIGGSATMTIEIGNKFTEETICYQTPAMPARRWIDISNALSDAGFKQDGDDRMEITLEQDDGKVDNLCKLVEGIARGAKRVNLQ